MKPLKSIPALGAFFVLIAVALSACGSGVAGNAVANVAGNPISTSAINHWMYVAAKGQAAANPGQPVIVPTDPPDFTKCIAQARKEVPGLKTTSVKILKADCKQLFTTLSSQVMDFLIKSYWYQADAHKLGIKVTDAQVQQTLATAKKARFSTEAQFQAFLTQSGQTLQDVNYRFRVQRIFQRLVARHTAPVTSAQISAYYSSHQSQFGTPESRDMRIVLARTQALATAARTALQHGASWTVVAKKYSIDSTKNSGGLLSGVTRGQQDLALSQAAFSAPANKLVGPVKGQFGYYVVQVVKITPATSRSLAQSTAFIRQALISQSQTAAQTAVDNHAKQDWLKQTTCRFPYAMADCNGYKAPAPSAAAGGAGTATTAAP